MKITIEAETEHEREQLEQGDNPASRVFAQVFEFGLIGRRSNMVGEVPLSYYYIHDKATLIGKLTELQERVRAHQAPVDDNGPS